MKKEWYEKTTPRSVDALVLWDENPRLDPDLEPSSTKSYVKALLEDETEKKSFYELLRSIAQKYISLDPIVVWKNETGKFCVAEGNRRVLALKLLLNPEMAPKGMRALVRSLANGMSEKVEKIPVYVAPSFDDAVWYINQRNNSSSMRKSWSRLQQFRWISSLYERYGDDMDVLHENTNMTEAELESIIRILKLVNLIRTEPIKKVLTESEFEKATSHKFPVTIIERFFASTEVKTAWGITFDKTNIRLQNVSGFLKAYACLIKNIVTEKPEFVIDTRHLSSDDIHNLLQKLPHVDISIADGGNIEEKGREGEDTGKTSIPPKPHRHRRKSIAGDPNRNNVIPNNLVLTTTDVRLQGIFTELKKLSPNVYINATAASLRIFLDLAIYDFIQSEAYEAEIRAKYHVELRYVTLKSRLEFVKDKLSGKEAVKVISHLLNEKNDYSLDVLNGYQHSKKTCYLNKVFINGFWDFLTPLLSEILDIKEMVS